MVTTSNIAVVFDIDGVLVKGPVPIDGAKEALELLNRNNVQTIFLTNSGRGTPEQKSELISNIISFEIPPNNLALSHTPFLQFRELYANKRVAIFGHELLDSMALDFGFHNYITNEEINVLHPKLVPLFEPPSKVSTRDIKDEPIEAVFLLNDCYSFYDIQLICDIVLTNGELAKPYNFSYQKVPIYVANPDIVYKGEHVNPRITMGAFISGLKAVFKDLSDGYDLEVMISGKPTDMTYKYVKNHMLAPNTKEIWMVGDNPKSDIQGALKNGWRSILVRTGLFQGINDDQFPAEYVVEDVSEAVDLILNGESSSVYDSHESGVNETENELLE
eukprot:TRINITY_DN1748_c0_g1_i1.p1 TRINITY_DN1748_c0_g1~~TRINITY_DN1748_c0_g1_i1.p1  ORF type:complete len:344 (+),score=97.36 TRINITY_DN1748_c0_g1_i1:38-1033(+)